MKYLIVVDLQADFVSGAPAVMKMRQIAIEKEV